ncbi:MAG: septum site-determining protein MinD [Armatimonadota bacterium]
MGKVIVITSGKGGVGKTTATANIGSGLAKQGKRVVMIDADIGLRNLDLVMGLENRIVFNLVDVVEGKCRSYKQAIIKDKRFDNLFLMPSAQSREKDAVSPEQMKSLCDELKQEFDFILLDCPAGIEQGFRNAVAGADEAVIVTNPEVSSIRDADRIIGLLEADELSRNMHIIINRIKSDKIKRGDMLSINDVKDILNIGILGVVPEDEKILTASNKGEPVVLDLNSKAGEAYRHIVQRILDPEVTLYVPGQNGGWFNKLKNIFMGKKAEETVTN